MNDDQDAIDDCVDEMTTFVKKMKWFQQYRGEVQGSMEQASQLSPSGTCYAVCVEGGSVSLLCVDT